MRKLSGTPNGRSLVLSDDPCLSASPIGCDMLQTLRRDLLTRHIYQWAKGVMPALSATEREAIEAGDVWWDAELFTGNPDWTKLLAFAPAKLSDEEQQFLDGPVEELCRMVNEWEVSWMLH